MKKLYSLLFLFLLVLSPVSWANNNTILFIVPQSAGTTTDAMARHIAIKLEKETNKTVQIEYAVGGDQTVAYNRMRTTTQPALMMGGTSLHVYGYVLNPQLSQIDDHLEILAKVAHAPIIWYTTPQSNIKNLKDLARAFKKNQQLSVATDVLGIRINPEAFKQQFRADNVVIVPYKSSAESIVGVLGGHADVGTQTPSPTLISAIREGKIIPLANSSPAPVTIGGKVVPPVAEIAPQFVTSWFMSTPKKHAVDPEVKVAISRILKDPSTKRFIEELSVVPDSLDAGPAIEYQNQYRVRFKLLADQINLQK
jgi:tripartite-type tricarboxylate transporter receptor subunit TctC